MGEFDDDSTPPRKPRARSHWGDRERVSVGAPHRTSPRGVPIVGEDRGEITPVTDLLDLIQDPELRRLFRLTWQHVDNCQLRFLQRLNETDGAELRDELEQHQDECLAFKVDLVGANGDDGRIGEIRKSHHALLKRLWWFIGLALGAVAAAVVYVALIASSYGALETKVATQQERIQLLENALFLRNRFAPAFQPGKVDP